MLSDDAFAEIKSAPERHRMQKAADYTDEWYVTDKGNAFRAFYVCAAGGAMYPCCTVTVTSLWKRLHEDLVATGQRWYCRYATRGTKRNMAC